MTWSDLLKDISLFMSNICFNGKKRDMFNLTAHTTNLNQTIMKTFYQKLESFKKWKCNKLLLDGVENIVTKGEIHLLPQCFQKLSAVEISKYVCILERVDRITYIEEIDVV